MSSEGVKGVEIFTNPGKFIPREYRGRFLGGILGVVCGSAILLFGFWNTFFVMLCGLVGIYIGRTADGGGDCIQSVREFFRSRYQR